ncbi:MAG TPA: LuxR C-terminal-related transcriptional regulator [Jatrophihabitans sp.]
MSEAQVSLHPAVLFAGLIPTQFAAPRVRPQTLARTTLVGQLNNATAPGQVTLLIAGAGWGKSTLLALWHARDPRPDRCGWFSIDSTDNESGRFWTGMLAAFATIDSELSAGPSRLFAAAQQTVVDDIVPALVNELMGLQEPATLVIDDYHLISDRKIQQSLRSFVEHLPPMLRLVISSRSSPALPVARLRARGQLVDLGVDGLRLSRDEAAELVRAQSLIELTEGEIDVLYDRTEGWVAGLHLASLSIGADANPHEFVTTFGHGDRGIGDYLLDEVLHREPIEIRSFLQQTSILNSLTASACDAVTGLTDSAAMLERIEEEQLFLVPLDNERSSYRYHHLFNDVLDADLHRSDPALAAESHHRAAEWHRDHGDPVEAVHHALATQDRTLAAELIATYSLGTCFHGGVETALGWLHALGSDCCRADVRLCLARAAVAFAGGRIAEMNRWTGLAELAAGRPGVSDELVTSTRALIALTKWSAAYSEGQVTLSLRVAQESNRHGEVPAPWRASAHTVLGWSLYRIGQFRPAQDTLSAASVLADEDGDGLNAMIANGILAIIAAANGLFHEVERLAAQADRASANNALGEHFDNWCTSFARGWSALSQQDNEHARTYFERALEVVRRGPRSVEIAEVLTALSIAEEALGDLASSAVHLAEAQHTLRTCLDPGYLLADPRNGSRHVQEPRAAEPYPGWINLTEAELLIARLVAEGLTNRAIASRLSLSQHTIDSHLKHTFTKLDIRSRVQLTRAVLANRP